MAKSNPRICANCNHWKHHNVDYGDFPEDECGSCKKTGETMYGDDEACDDFKSTKRQNNRKPNYRK